MESPVTAGSYGQWTYRRGSGIVHGFSGATRESAMCGGAVSPRIFRPSEKLREELSYPDEERLGTDHPKPMLAVSVTFADLMRFNSRLQQLKGSLNRCYREEVYGALQLLVLTCHPRTLLVLQQQSEGRVANVISFSGPWSLESRRLVLFA